MGQPSPHNEAWESRRAGLLEPPAPTPAGTDEATRATLHALDPSVPPAQRAASALRAIDLLRPALAAFDPATAGVEPNGHVFRSIYMGPAYHADQAVEELRLIRLLQARESGRPIPPDLLPKVVIAVPKSGSSLLGICLGNMVKRARGLPLDNRPFDYRGYPAWWDRGGLQDWNLRPELGCDPLFRLWPGGIYKGHVPPTDQNLRILDLYKPAPYAIIVRDPRDQIVAAWCDKRRWLKNAGRLGDRPGPDATHRALDAFLRSGALLDALEFVGRWLVRRHRDRSLIVTYERFMADPIATLSDLARHFRLDLPRHELQAIYRYASPITDRKAGIDRSGLDPDIYPLGWTGEVGAFRRYIDGRNLDTFREVLDALDRASPWARPIIDLYPDLA